uniref:RAB3A interacting protein (rabin3)-like 1 n=1 Tax=Poecilia mexicana TaxID=48701 RepID=A0A3B3XZP3_9TELE
CAMDDIRLYKLLLEQNRVIKDPLTSGRVSPSQDQRSEPRCLPYRSQTLAVENNSLTIEPVAMSALPVVKASALECGGPKKCALSGLSRVCQHRIKLGDKGSYYYISPSSRARITAVCNFFTYIRYILQGLVRQNAEQIFWEVMRLRREMTVAKLGFYLTDQG